MKRSFELPVALDIIVLSISLLFSFIAWKIAMSFPPDQIPLYILMVGLLASFLLFGMVFGLSRAEKKATKADAEHWRLFAAIQSMPLGVVITDTQGNIVTSNDAFSKLFINNSEQWTLEKISMALEEIFPVMESYQRVLDERRSVPWTIIVVNERKLELSMTPIFSEKVGLLGVLILLRGVMV